MESICTALLNPDTEIRGYFNEKIEQIRQDSKEIKDKKSILGQIKSFKTDDKAKSNKKDHSKGAER